MKTEYKNLTFELHSLTRGPDKKGIAKMFVAVTGNVDDYGDRIVPGAFTKSLTEWKASGRPIPVIYSHQWNDPRAHVGQVIDAQETTVNGKSGLLTTQQYDLDLPPEQSYAQQVFHLLETGRLTQASIGYMVKAYDIGVDEKSGQPIRELQDIDLIEVGPTLLGANRETELLEVASAEGKAASGALPYQNLPLASKDLAWDALGACSRMWQWAGGDKDLDPAKFAKGFLWRDPEGDPAVRASYKLPIADVIDGKLMAVPRGIYAAAAVLQGARGGTNIPEADQAKLKEHLSLYYAKMGETAPWDAKAMEAGVKVGRMLSQQNIDTLQGAVEMLREGTDAVQGLLDQVDASANTSSGDASATTVSQPATAPTGADLWAMIELESL